MRGGGAPGRPMQRALPRSEDGGQFLMSEVPLHEDKTGQDVSFVLGMVRSGVRPRDCLVE